MNIKYRLNEYRLTIKMSHRKHILVEGSSDKRFIETLLDELKDYHQGINCEDILIDSAEDFIEIDTPSNREKVEIVCENINNQPYYQKLVGLVDREFRGFDFAQSVQDTLSKHNIIDRVIWTRGHSFENYFFDINILRNPLRDILNHRFRMKALDLFTNNFHEIIKLACCISFTCLELQRINQIKSSIIWKIINIDNGIISINIDLWKEELKNKINNVYDVDIIIDNFKKWLDKLKDVDSITLKWSCHGHIGMSLIWAAYARCIYTMEPEIVLREKAASNSLTIKEDIRSNLCATSWSKSVISNYINYPKEIFSLLNISI